MKVLNPLTGSHSVTLEETLDSKRIVSQYKGEYDFDASAYFENVDGIGLYRCNETGYRFYHPATISGNSELYEHLQKLSWYYASSRWEHDLANKQITEGDYVLEVGCGFGSFLQKLRDRNVRCAGLEFNPRAVETAAANGLHVNSETIHDHSQRNSGTYSVVCTFQVVEHIAAVGDFIADCLRAIKPYGKLIVSVPNNNPFLFKREKYHTLNLPPHHMGLWSKRSLTNLQKVFAVRTSLVMVEPLFDRESYFRVYLEHLRLSFPLFGTLISRILRPYHRPLMKLVSPFVEGRNLFAVYIKLPESDLRRANENIV